jgi:hypothetical protein
MRTSLANRCSLYEGRFTMRLKHAWLAGLVALVGIVILLINANATAQANPDAGATVSGAASIVATTKNHPAGIPAITVQSAVSTTPRVQKSDVIAFLKSHPFPAGPAVAGATPVLTAVDLISSKEASQRLKGESIGLSDNAPVYYVQWKGPFNPVNESVPAGVTIKPVATGVEVFDATTGNLLLWWIPS